MGRTKKLCLSGVLIALIVALSTYCQIPLGPSIRLDLGYAVVFFAALYLGPVYGCTIALLARIINDLLFSGSVSFWWAIGSAFFGLTIGLLYKFIRKITNKRIQVLLVILSTIVVAFISFAGIVPAVAFCVGIDYRFMIGIGILASIADSMTSILVGYPAFLSLARLKRFNQN